MAHLTEPGDVPGMTRSLALAATRPPLRQAEEHKSIPPRSSDVPSDRAEGSETSTAVLKALVQDVHQNCAAVILLHNHAARHRQPWVVIGNDTGNCRVRKVIHWPLRSAACANAQARLQGNCQCVLPSGFWQTTFSFFLE